MWCHYILLSLFVFVQLYHVKADNRSRQCHRPVVEVLVSPLVSKDTIRSLILYWSLDIIREGDYVALYLSEDLIDPVFTSTVTSRSGWVDTSVQQNRSGFDSLTFTAQCLGYWAAIISGSDGQVLASSCLGTSPRWMETHLDTLQNLTLKSMFLPGTHNSAAFLVSDRPFRETFVQKYVFNQDESVLNQLIYGARVLDLRVGHYPGGTDVWWANHGVVRLRPLHQVLDDVIMFLNMTQEIVVMDFHYFPVGFHKDTNLVHQALIKYLEEIFAGYLVPRSLGWDAPVSALWGSGRRLVLAYNYALSHVNSKYVWSGVSQQWANAQSIDVLHNFLVRANSRKHSSAWSAMAELTPSFSDIIQGHLGSLRQMAYSTNFKVTEWFGKEWGTQCNIVSVDFLRSSGIVSSAINWNLRRARGEYCDLR